MVKTVVPLRATRLRSTLTLVTKDAMAKSLLRSIAPLLPQRIHLQIQILLKSRDPSIANLHISVSKLVYIIYF